MKPDDVPEISTLYDFQGKEKDVVIFSFVWSNRKNEIGMLKNDQLMKIALSWAKKTFCLVGNTYAMFKNKFM